MPYADNLEELKALSEAQRWVRELSRECLDQAMDAYCDLLIYGVAHIDGEVIEMYPRAAGHKWTDGRDYSQHRTDDCPVCSPVMIVDAPETKE